MCLVGEKICGYKAKKFINKIVMNKVMIMASVDFSAFPKENFTSFLNVAMIFIIIFFVVFLIFHDLGLINTGPNSRILHAKENIEELGSNTENRFVIILFASSILTFLSFLLSTLQLFPGRLYFS